MKSTFAPAHSRTGPTCHVSDAALNPGQSSTPNSVDGICRSKTSSHVNADRAYLLFNFDLLYLHVVMHESQAYPVRGFFPRLVACRAVCGHQIVLLWPRTRSRSVTQETRISQHAVCLVLVSSLWSSSYKLRASDINKRSGSSRAQWHYPVDSSEPET